MMVLCVKRLTKTVVSSSAKITLLSLTVAIMVSVCVWCFPFNRLLPSSTKGLQAEQSHML